MNAPRKLVQLPVTQAELEQARPCRERGCGALIVFATLANGRRQVLDVATKEPALDGGWLLQPHWGRCPGADRFRRTRPLS